MGNVMHLHMDRHAMTQRLLPWYVGQSLSIAERAGVDAHLADCAACRADLAEERALRADVVALPLAEDRGWAAIRRTIDVRAQSRVSWRWGSLPLPGAVRRAGWLIAAQIAILLIGAGILARQEAPARYHALGAAAVPRAGNIVVLFRPQARERDLRAALLASDARLVDGPTASDAYVLQVPAAHVSASLARLRTDPAISLAQPIGTGIAR